MALGDNAIVALFDDGDEITVATDAAVGAGRFVKVSAPMQGGPLLDTSTVAGPLTKGNLIRVAACGAGQRAFGVTRWDTAAADDVVGVYCGTQVVPMVADGAVTAGDIIMSGSAGGAKTWVSAASDANHELAIAVTSAADTATVYVKLAL